MASVMMGRAKIPSYKVFIFPAGQTTQKLAHHFLSTLKNVDNVVNSGTEFSTFNPFVVGSTPAGPTSHEVKTPCTKVWGVFFRLCSTAKTHPNISPLKTQRKSLRCCSKHSRKTPIFLTVKWEAAEAL